MAKEVSSPFSGVKVLDFSMFLSGPRASQILADFGAEVVKVEPPGGETMRLWVMLVPGQAESMSHWHRNKKGITLNIRTPEGRDMVKKMIRDFDVLIENLAPGAMEKCGLSYEDLREINPGLVYCSISGFGKNAVHSDRVAFDIIAQATGGIMDAQRTRERSPGVFFGDLVSGAYAAMGIMAALRSRDATGKGQLVDVSMQDVMYFHNYRAFQRRMHEDIEKVSAALGGGFEELFGGEEGLPFWKPYRTKDGHVAVVFLTDRQWADMCDLIGKPELKDDERFANLITRVKHRDAIKEAVRDWMEGKTSEEIERELDKCKIPCGRVLSVDEVNVDENLRQRGMLASIPDDRGNPIPVPGIPIKLSDTPGEISSRGPKVGEHNREVYGKLLGLSDEEIEALAEKGVI